MHSRFRLSQDCTECPDYRNFAGSCFGDENLELSRTDKGDLGIEVHLTLGRDVCVSATLTGVMVETAVRIVLEYNRALDEMFSHLILPGYGREWPLVNRKSWKRLRNWITLEPQSSFNVCSFLGLPLTTNELCSS